MKMPRNTTMLALSFSVFTASTAGLGLMLASKSSEIEYVEVEVEVLKKEYITVERPAISTLCPEEVPVEVTETAFTEHWVVLNDGLVFVKNKYGVTLKISHKPFEKDKLVFELNNVSFGEGETIDYFMSTNKTEGYVRGSSTVSSREATTASFQLEDVYLYDSFVINNMREDTQLKILIGGQEHIFGMRGSFHAITELL